MEKLSDRDKHRLRIAAALLRAKGFRFDCPRDQFYAEIRRTINALDATSRDKLREMTDWVEGYELAEQWERTKP